MHQPKRLKPLDIDSRFLELEKNPHWKVYSVQADSSWARLERRQLAQVKAWARRELTPRCPQRTSLFYPFAGPDFLYAYCFFQNADDYLLIGLESVGTVPEPEEIPADSLGNYFRAMRVALNDILTISFFKTNDMMSELGTKELDGILPLLLVFLARTGNEITWIEPVRIDENGQIIPASFPEIAKHDPGKMNGVEIAFEKDGLEKTLYYFSVDLSNFSLASKPGFKRFLDDRGKECTLVKAASYLMHKKYFSQIRTAILEHSNLLLEDDSGIPLRWFDTAEWKIQPYGSYTSPIPMFKEWVQEDLLALYQDPNRVKPLPFGVGYNWQTKKSNLMLAWRGR